MKNILITGGAGFIGSSLALKLSNLGYSVKILDNLSKQIHGDYPEESPLFMSVCEKTVFQYGDVTSRKDMENAIKTSDAIIHLAAETGVGQSMYEIERYSQVNIGGTSLLWDILSNMKHSVKKVIVASSRAIYGEGRYTCKSHGYVYPNSRKNVDMLHGDFNIKCPYCNENTSAVATSENSMIHPTSIYGFTKQAQEELSMIAGKSIGIPVVALRYQNVYGPGQSLSNPYTGILSIFSTRIKNGNNIVVFEDGEESRDFVFIDDAVDATILGLEKDEANFESFNVGTGVRTDVLTVAKILKASYNSSVDISITGNYRLGDIRVNFADITKIKQILGFVPKVTFSKGILKFIDWVNMQDAKKDNYQESIVEMKRKGLYR